MHPPRETRSVGPATVVCHNAMGRSKRSRDSVYSSIQALAAGECLGKMNGIVSLNRLQAHGKWEMSA
jgi:hypothetical protein